MAEYVHPEMLVSTDWVAEHANDPNVRIVESDEDVLLYEVGHVPGAIKVDWHSELQHQVVRDYIDKEAFAKLVGARASATITPSCSTATATTGGPATPSGSSRCTGIGTAGL